MYSEEQQKVYDELVRVKHFESLVLKMCSCGAVNMVSEEDWRTPLCDSCNCFIKNNS